MINFEKRFVHYFWNDELKGKKGFVADTLEELKSYVQSENKQYLVTLTHSENEDFEFTSNNIDVCYQFCYYDPLYEIKVAYEEGKTIQFKHYQYSKEGEWEDTIMPPQWCEDTEYRIKPNDEYEIVILYGLGLRIIQSSVSTEFRRILFKGTEKECKQWVKDNYYLQIVIDGYFENEPIVYKEKGVINDPWKETKELPYDWDFDHYEYRINRAEESKEDKYVPFENTQELIEAWEKKYPTNKDRPNGTMPLIWIKEKKNENAISLITDFTGYGVSTSYKDMSFDSLFEKYTFADGSVCGKRR